MHLAFTKFIKGSAYQINMVYLRAKTFKRKNDPKPRTYYYLVEAKRTANKVQQKVLRYLGTAETILNNYEELDNFKKPTPK